MDARVQRFDAAIEDFGETGDLGDIANRQPCFSERLPRAARGNQLDTEAGQSAGKFDQPRLVADTEEGSADNAQSHGCFLADASYSRSGVIICMKWARRISLSP